MTNDIIVIDSMDVVSQINYSEEEKIRLLEEDGYRYISIFEHTPEHCMAAVRNYGRALKKIPKTLHTEELCMAAVQHDGSALAYVSKKILTKEICREAVKQKACAIYSVPEKYMDSELYELAVKKDSSILERIPSTQITSEIRAIALASNGLALQYINPSKRSKKLCLISVKSNPLALEFVPEKYLSDGLCADAIENNPLALEFVPEKYLSDELCVKAIENNPLALEFIPEKYLTDELCINAVKKNGMALKFIPIQKISFKLCRIALHNDPMALRFIPSKFIDKEIAQNAIERNWKVFNYLPVNMYSLGQCKEFFSNLVFNLAKWQPTKWDILEIFANLPPKINKNREIIYYQRRLHAREFIRRYYDKELVSFVVEEKILFEFTETGEQKIEVKRYKRFQSFYEYLEKNLNGVDLLDCPFEKINMKKIDWTGALIKPEILVENGIYNPAFYENNIERDSELGLFTPSIKNEVVESKSLLHEIDFSEDVNDESYKLYYITDIHLNHKLMDEFPECATKEIITHRIRKYIQEMVASVTKGHRDYLLIGGDVSFNFEIATIFYQQLVEFWNSDKIIVILGNHELWNYSISDKFTGKCTIDDIVLQYRIMLSSLGIIFLHNDLLVFSKGRDLFTNKKYIIPERQLNQVNPEQLQELCRKSSLTILGGLGFSGLNREFNATNGIYRETIRTLEEDIAQTIRFENLYKRIKAILPNEKLVVFTHTPKDNWTNEEFHKKWIYLNGHTHRNEFIVNEKCIVYADNQVGYYNKGLGLKKFYISSTYDIFRNYEDGIYNISREEYLEFNRGIGVMLDYNRTEGMIYMLKKEGFYCFIFSNNKGKLYLLNGGAIKVLEYQDLNYYYENMKFYSETIKKTFSKYFSALKKISRIISEIGGSGTIHGCIVDIDFFNHIYLNPFDGCLTIYYASSIVDKYVFPDMKALLLKKRKDLYYNYIKLLERKNEYEVILSNKNKVDVTDTIQFVEDTYMYQPSRRMKSLQYLMDANVIRVWKDEIVQKGKIKIEKSIDELVTNGKECK